MATLKALIAGVTGISGGNLAEHLLAKGSWDVYGIARREGNVLPGVHLLNADLTDDEATRAALAKPDVTHAFFTCWSRGSNETENCRVNGLMLRNFLDALDAAENLHHVALVTGTKHYLGSFDAYGKGLIETPFREDQPRLPGENFYYVQEDLLVEKAGARGFSWSVHRAHTLIGYAIGNLMNMGLTLAIYASICKASGRPFVFPGSPQQYEGITDVTDARLLAKHMEWAATTPLARNEAFNVANGDVFRWRWLWPRLAAYFAVEPADYPGHSSPLAEQMKLAAPIWERIVQQHGLVAVPLDQLASWWHSDADLGRSVEAFNDLSKSRRLGFTTYQETLGSFTDLFDRLRSDRIIP